MKDAQDQNVEFTGYKLPAGTVGTLNELRIAADLMRRGYDVFRALSPCCSCDLIIIDKNSVVSRVEVRTGVALKSGSIWANRNHRADYLAIVYRTQIIYEPPLLPASGEAQP